MISAGDFRNGVTFEEDGNVYQIIEFQHVKPGKGAAFVRTKIKNVMTGSVTEKTYSPSEKFESAYIERREMGYSYNDSGLYYFMDNETYEMIPISESDLPENFRFIKENMNVKVLSYKGNVFGLELPMFVELTVIETEPGFKGNTATNTLKPAILETGAEVRVPLFIEEGEKIRIDTRTGEYMERA
ncbi:MAG: elongation factor P [Ruminococcaceae bacterium]|jgi:elongation factor P|nr:elongation factor P [Oscillospiraceae bacterium]